MVATTTHAVTKVAGDYWTFPLVYLQIASRPPVDLTGFHAEALLAWDGGTLELTEDNGGAAVTDPPNGKFQFVVDQSATANIPAGSASLWITLFDPAGHPDTKAIWPISVKRKPGA